MNRRLANFQMKLNGNCMLNLFRLLNDGFRVAGKL
jgi:hypothetical protein